MATTERLDYIIAIQDKMTSTLNNIESKIKNFDSTIANTKQKTESVFAGLVKFNIASSIAEGIAGIGKAAADNFLTFEKTQVQFEQLFGADAQKKLKDVQDLADKTNFSFEELSDATVKMSMRGIDTSSASLMKFADFANATGKPVGQLSEALMDVSNSERWKEFGVETVKVGNKLQVTWDGVTKTVENSANGVGKAIEQIAAESSKTKGITEKMSATVGGQLSTLSDKWNRMLLNLATTAVGSGNIIGEGIGLITLAIDKLNYGVTSLADGTFLNWLERLQSTTTVQVIESIIASLTTLGAIMFINNLRMGLFSTLWLGLQVSFASGWFNLVKFFGTMIPGLTMTNGLLAIGVMQTALMTGGLTLLVGGIALAFLKYDGLWDNIKIGASNAVKAFKNLDEIFVGGKAFNWDNLTKGFDNFVDVIERGTRKLQDYKDMADQMNSSQKEAERFYNPYDQTLQSADYARWEAQNAMGTIGKGDSGADARTKLAYLKRLKEKADRERLTKELTDNNKGVIETKIREIRINIDSVVKQMTNQITTGDDYNTVKTNMEKILLEAVQQLVNVKY